MRPLPTQRRLCAPSQQTVLQIGRRVGGARRSGSAERGLLATQLTPHRQHECRYESDTNERFDNDQAAQSARSTPHRHGPSGIVHILERGRGHEAQRHDAGSRLLHDRALAIGGIARISGLLGRFSSSARRGIITTTPISTTLDIRLMIGRNHQLIGVDRRHKDEHPDHHDDSAGEQQSREDEPKDWGEKNRRVQGVRGLADRVQYTQTEQRRGEGGSRTVPSAAGDEDAGASLPRRVIAIMMAMS